MCVETEEQAERCQQKSPPRPGTKEQLVSDGHLHKTIKHLMFFPEDKNEGDDAIPKELLFFLLS